MPFYYSMDFFSHILWTHIPFRNKIWHDEAILFAMLPDVGFLLIMLYSMFGTTYSTSYSEAMNTLPPVLLNIYFLLHSFVTVFIVGLVLWKLKPRLLPALSGWVIHILLDIPFHETNMFATRFIYPLSSDVYFNGITWLNIQIILLNYLALVLVYVYVLWRESKKQRMGEGWKPDWIDKINKLVDGLINRKRIPAHHGTGHDIRGASPEISGENEEGVEAIEDNVPRTVLCEDGG